MRACAPEEGTAISTLSPGYEANDLGYQKQGDVVNAHVGSGYKWTKGGKLRRYQSLEQPVLLEGVINLAQWDRLRKSGAKLASGAGLQAALSPLAFSVWAGTREAKPL